MSIHRNHASRQAVRVRTIDLDAVQQYFAGLESLAREARTTRDARVMLAALQVMTLQGKTVAEMGGRS